MSLQVDLERRPRVRACSRRGVGLVCPQRRCVAFADRSDDRRRVEWITSWTTHGSPRPLRRQTGKTELPPPNKIRQPIGYLEHSLKEYPVHAPQVSNLLRHDDGPEL